ncbi:MAG: methyltransferase domain-containing protein [Archaeoglobaceae archaeon]
MHKPIDRKRPWWSETCSEDCGEDICMSANAAINREKRLELHPSRPLKIALNKGLINGKVLDFGCGYGVDVEYLREIGYEAFGYDRCRLRFGKYADRSVLKDDFYDTVTNFYVLNTVYPETRIEVLNEIRRVLKKNGTVLVAVRDVSEDKIIKGIPYLDGVVTKKQTFQKTFDREELEKLLELFFSDVELISIFPLMMSAKKP